MSVKQEDEKKSDSSKIAQAAGFSILLPGESGEKYQMGFRSTVEELGAKTPLQVYLAEKNIPISLVDTKIRKAKEIEHHLCYG